MWLEWRGINSTQICFEKSCFSFKKDHVTYAIEIAVIGNEKKISISVDTPTTFEKIYHYLGDIRRYEYLVDGAFYCMKKCKTYGIDVTNSITDVGKRMMIRIEELKKLIQAYQDGEIAERDASSAYKW